MNKDLATDTEKKLKKSIDEIYTDGFKKGRLYDKYKLAMWAAEKEGKGMYSIEYLQGIKHALQYLESLNDNS